MGNKVLNLEYPNEREIKMLKRPAVLIKPKEEMFFADGNYGEMTN